MLYTKYTYEVEPVVNGWILREIKEKPVWADTTQGNMWSGHHAGTEREVTTYVYASNQYRDMLQYLVKHTYQGEGKTPYVELIENEYRE